MIMIVMVIGTLQYAISLESEKEIPIHVISFVCRSRASIFRKKSNVRVDQSATPLVENDVRVLRDKAERSSSWSNDPAVREKIKLMTVDEAAAIMLYTQGHAHPVC